MAVECTINVRFYSNLGKFRQNGHSKPFYTTHRWKLRIFKRLAVVVGWALPTINAVTLRARGANHLSQTDRNGGQGISIALLIQSFDPTLQSLLQTVITGKESAIIPNAKYKISNH